MPRFDDDYKPSWRRDIMPLEKWAEPLMKLTKEEIIKLYFEAIIDANGILDELMRLRGENAARKRAREGCTGTLVHSEFESCPVHDRKDL